MNLTKTVKAALAPMLMAMALTGCGGGGGGSDDEAGGVAYEGKTSPADISKKNAPDLTGEVVGVYAIVGNDNLRLRSASTAATGPARSFQRYAMAQIAIIREKHVGGYMQAALDSGYAARTDIDESRPCDKGKLRTSGFLEDDFTGQVTITFDKCKQGKDFLDGALTFRIDRFDLGIETRMRLSFTALHVRNNDFDVTLGGDASYSSDTASNKQTEKITDLVIVDNNSGRSLRIVDLVSVYTFDNIFVPRRVTIKIKSGRVYVSRYGYVDVESTVVIDFASIDQSFPDSGVYDLTANGSIRATAQSRTSVLIEADTNDNLGDGYEFTATIDWSDL